LLLYSKKVCGKTNSIFVFVLFFGKKKIVRSLFHALFDPRLYYVRRTMDIYIYIIQIICPKVLSYIMYNNKYNNNNLTTSNILQLKFKFQNKNFFFFFKFYLVCRVASIGQQQQQQQSSSFLSLLSSSCLSSYNR
jgi:hypothetical protein